jgi:hypothetical protein
MSQGVKVKIASRVVLPLRTFPASANVSIRFLFASFVQLQFLRMRSGPALRPIPQSLDYFKIYAAHPPMAVG